MCKCDYRLVVDNLMDLTHEAFVHGSSIGNRAVAEAPFEVTHTDATATVTRWMLDIDAAAVLGLPVAPRRRGSGSGATAGRSSASRRPAR
jgi:phenylpropionate dioxygenase-like ring-hydroxylating dioxygenase large terminal subunit